MFIREVKKQRSKDSQVFYQYNLVQTSRVEGNKVKQRVILYLGSDKLLRDKENRKKLLQALKSKIFGQPDLLDGKIAPELQALAEAYYQKYKLKYPSPSPNSSSKGASLPPKPSKAEFHNIDIKGLEVSDVKSFGAEHLCRQVLDKFQLEEYLTSLGLNRSQARKCLIAIAARAIYSSSEHKTAEILKTNSELAACYGHDSPITHKQLYSISEQLFQHKSKIDSFLYQRITDMFDINDKLVIFDISNTYFETGKKQSKLSQYGRSKEKRSDCPLVVFTGVVNAQGFIRHSRIYEGNRPDTNTLEDMIADLEIHSGTAAKKTIVMDAGIATDDNLALLRKKNLHYVCVSRQRIKNYPVSKENQVVELTDRGKQKVALSVFHPKDKPDTWMYVQSENKRKKEQSISEKLSRRFEEDLMAVQAGLDKKGGTKKYEKVWERIGRIKEKHKHVSGGYAIEVEPSETNDNAKTITWKKKPPQPQKQDKENGVYFIRTSYKNPSETELWEIYNTIREVESTFRCLKTDLKMRPVHHQNDERIEGHLYLTMLAYQLVNTIRYMLQQEGIHYDWNNILRLMATQTIQTLELPTDTKTIYLRQPAKPIKEVSQIFRATNCSNTQKATKKYVVYH